jgi:transcriptional regulator GlxA family with amidase domain
MCSETWIWSPPGTSGKGRVRILVRWILADPSRCGSVESLAERAALSPRAFSRLFLRETGISPAKFVERSRVRLACRLLDEGDLRVESIAARCGFQSTERMRRAFHRALGVSPRRYATPRRTRITPAHPSALLGLRHDA